MSGLSPEFEKFLQSYDYDSFVKAQGPGVGGFDYYPERLASAFGFKGPLSAPTGKMEDVSVPGMHDNGPSIESRPEMGPSPEWAEVLRRYRYAPAVEGKKNNPAMDIYDQAGNLVHDNWRTGDHTGSMMSFMGKAMPLLVAGGFGAGALGLAGIGPMAGASGAGAGAGGAGALGLEGASFALPGAEAGFGLSNIGAAAAESAPSWLSGLGAENLAAIEAFSAANPVTANSLMSGLPSFGGAAAGGAMGGYAGAGIGPATGVDSLPALTQSGVNSAALGSSGSLPGLSAGGIPWGQVGKYLGGQALSVGSQMYGANKAAGAMSDATNKANDLARYAYDTTRADNAPALAARNSALSQMQALLSDPSTLTKQPGYQFGLDQGNKALNNGAAARGMTYSGAQGKALQRYGQDYAGTKLDASFNRLSSLANAGQPGAGTIAAATGNYGNTVGNNINAQGEVDATKYLVGGNALGNAVNGLTAYGERKGWWQP